MKRLLYTIAITGLLVGCSSEIDTTPVSAVVQGWIDTDGYPTVLFTSSLSPGEVGSSINDKVIIWGKVTLSDGIDTIILTGGRNSNLIPPYRYYTYKIKGKPGRTYKITAEYEELYAEAESYMYDVTPIDSVSLKRIEGSDSLWNGRLYFTAPADCPAYYCVNITDSARYKMPLPAIMGIAVAEHPGECVEIPLMNPKCHIDTVPYIPNLIDGQRLKVSLCRVTEDVYNFWSSYSDLILLGGSQFINVSSSLNGNVKGGFGVWSVQATSSVMINVK